MSATKERDPELRCGAPSGYYDEPDFMDCERRVGHAGEHVHFTCAEVRWEPGTRPADEEDTANG